MTNVPASGGKDYIHTTHSSKQELLSGFILLACACIAMVWANGPYEHLYHSLLMHQIRLPLFSFSFTPHQFINDALMVIFFFAVGLEIKRELLTGELASRRKATLPIIAAIGGVLTPAFIYAFFNSTGLAARGWAIPMATDIAFSLAILALLSRRVPLSLKIFLVALAIVDDLIAVLVIALFYSSSLNVPALFAATVTLIMLTAMNRKGITSPFPYVAIGILLWAFVLSSGVHATIAGVLLAFTIPHRVKAPKKNKRKNSSKNQISSSPLDSLAHAIHGFVLFFVMPVFALANAGVTSTQNLGEAFAHPVTIGTVLGLLIGKPLGIVGASYLAVVLGAATLPKDVRWSDMIGVGFIAGIGFTMSLFVSNLAFKDTLPILALDQFARIGIMLGSTSAAFIGLTFLLINRRDQHV